MSQNLSDLSISESSISIEDLPSVSSPKNVVVSGFVDSIRPLSKFSFLILRQRICTIQCILPKSDLKIDIESFVQVKGFLKPSQILVISCSVKHLEIEIKNISVLGPVREKLPFSLKDASAPYSSDRPSVKYNLRLDNRFLDFRSLPMQSIVRVIDTAMFAFRDFLRKNGFIEIKTTKIIQSGSEGGANLFKMDYFNKKAFLAQSPQLYKQMAIIGGLEKVYEIGHVYRAEESNINRYLSEFVGLDIEMVSQDYIKTIKFIHKVLINIFKEIMKTEEYEIIRKYKDFKDLVFKEEPLIITHREAIDLLKAKGIEIEYEDDFNREQEKTLGSIIKEKHGLDLFVVKDYPKAVRAFYTYSEGENTRSYDFILRGEEILSGAKRENDYEKLKKAIEEKGLSVESLNNYLEPFKFGVPPHAGCGIGLERLLKSFFGFDDIRHFSLFPRDPSRLYP